MNTSVLVLVGQLLKRQREHIRHRQPIVYCSTVRVRLIQYSHARIADESGAKNERGGGGGGVKGGLKLPATATHPRQARRGCDGAHGAVYSTASSVRGSTHCTSRPRSER